MQNISYSYVRNPETILKVIIVPQIPIFYCINDGLLIQRLKHKELNFDEINNWLIKDS